MTTREDLRERVLREVETCPFEELPDLMKLIVEGMVGVQKRLGVAEAPVSRADSLISPEAAAKIAGVPKRRIYAWAERKRWACKPSRKVLRIDERGFRSWLTGKKAA